jgi:hypothetical protein
MNLVIGMLAGIFVTGMLAKRMTARVWCALIVWIALNIAVSFFRNKG